MNRRGTRWVKLTHTLTLVENIFRAILKLVNLRPSGDNSGQIEPECF